MRFKSISVVALIATFLLVACEKPTAQAPAVPPAQRELVRGLGGEPDSFDPQLARTNETHTVLRDLCEGLTSVDRDGNVAPGSAESWTYDRAALRYVFRLRPQLRWSNGTPLVAADFVRGLQRLVDPKVASPFAQMLVAVRGASAITAGNAAPDTLGITAPDDSTVVIDLASPVPHLPAVLSHPSTCPAAPGGRTSEPGPWNAAYTVAEWLPRQDIKLTKNPNYWDAANVSIERVRYSPNSDARVELRRYRAGELQLTYNIPPDAVAEARQDFGTQVHVGPSLATHYIGFRMDRGPFAKSSTLREALSAAVDRDALANKVLSGSGVAAYSLVPPGTIGAGAPPLEWRTWSREQREAHARKLYSEAGYSPSRPLALTLHTNSNATVQQAMVAVAAMWSEVLGAKVTLDSYDGAAYFADLAQGKHEVFRSSWVADYNDAMAFLEVFAAGPETNFLRFNSERYRALLASSLSQDTPEARRALLTQAEGVLLAEHALIPLYHGTNRRIVQPDLLGFQDNALRVTLSKWLSWRGDS
jgi:ABC-type oligopeptide transport system substrate-binding subunit